MPNPKDSFSYLRKTMDIFTAQEIRDIESNEDLKDMINILDSVLDGETFHIRNTDTDITMQKEFKPVIPDGLIESTEAFEIKNKSVYAFILRVFISLIIDLNPNNFEHEEDYIFRIACIINVIITGCILKSENVIISETKFDKDYLKNNGKVMATKNIEIVRKVERQLISASTFLAFSSMNMVRFNHHFPIEKINLITKSINSLPEAQRNRILEEEKLETFYNCFVPAARLLNDKKYYEKYILKKEDENNKYFLYQALGAYKVDYEEEIIKIRKVNTPNGFLICDIINEIYTDLKNKKVLFMVPYINEIGNILKIRNHLRKNPFGYHPSKYFYNCKAKDYDNIVSEFQNIMKKIGSFVYQYSECMFPTVRDAKCRNKYEKCITKDDEILVQYINEVTKVKADFSKEDIKIIKNKLVVRDFKVTEDTDVNSLNKSIVEQIEKISESN